MCKKKPGERYLLLVTDDTTAAGSLIKFLNSEGFRVQLCNGQRRAVKAVQTTEFDLALLDSRLSDGDILSLCKSIRVLKDIPIIFLSTAGDESSVMAGLDMGADDYIVRPVRPGELVSRIGSVLRRYRKDCTILQYGDIKVDTVKGMVTKNGRDVFLSALEYRILLIFFANSGRVLSRQELLEQIWAVGGDYVNDNTLTVYIKRIREKIEDDVQNPKIIRTVRGLGYRAGE